jgi:light-regulated signal transduction histidine kinase (bacteriophytochrome)
MYRKICSVSDSGQHFGFALEFAANSAADPGGVLNNIEKSGFRANEVLANVRNLFQDTDHEQQSIDVNSLTVEVLQSLQAELNDHDVKTDVELASDLPHIIGHRVQLQEVILNLVHNAIEAMASVKVDNRALRVRTKSLAIARSTNPCRHSVGRDSRERSKAFDSSTSNLAHSEVARSSPSIHCNHSSHKGSDFSPDRIGPSQA